MTLAALAVTSATTGAAATDRDDLLDGPPAGAPTGATTGEPTLAVVAGSSVSYVQWPEAGAVYRGEWSSVGAIEASRTATTLDLGLPDEILALPFVDADVTIDAIATSGPTPSARVAAWTDDFMDGTLTFDVQAMLSNAATAGIADVGAFEISVDTLDSGVLLDLFIVVLLVDGAAGSAEVTLGVPPAKDFAVEFTATDTRVAPGGRILLEAWPGFFGPAAPQPVKAYHYAGSSWAELTSPITVSVDGSRLTMPVPAGFGPGSQVEIRLGDETTVERRTIAFGLIPASTHAVKEYVTAVYNDLFGRDPDPGGLATWTSALSSGTRYGAVADAITSSTEFRAGLIRDAYAQYLGRRPDPSGLAFWLDQMRKGMHIQQMEAGFLASAEYYRYAGSNDPDWVYWLYMDVLGREPAVSEISFWVPIVRAQGRTAVAKGFLYSTERLTADVDGYYQWLLRRKLDPAGRASWVRAIQNGTRVEAIIAGIISSAEYRGNVPVG